MYHLFELQLEKSNENNKFLFEFNVVDDDENADVFYCLMRLRNIR